jgi:protein-disulfide isomerase
VSGRPAGEGRRERLIKLASAMAFLAVVAVAVLIVITQSQTDGGDTSLEGVGEVRRLLRGVPQDGMVLGEPRAKLTLVEFADLQCPTCKAYAEETLPALIRGPVARGEAKLDFRNFTIVGPESTTAGAAALAAGEQGHGWSFVELFYRNQGGEETGYVTDSFLTALARAAGVADIARWNRIRRGDRVLDAVAATTAEAEGLGFTGTPSFALESPSTPGLQAVGAVPSQETLESALAGTS